jgi:hypothetical protein
MMWPIKFINIMKGQAFRSDPLKVIVIHRSVERISWREQWMQYHATFRLLRWFHCEIPHCSYNKCIYVQPRVYCYFLSSFSFPYPTKWSRYNMFLSCCDKDSVFIFTTGRLPDVNLLETGVDAKNSKHSRDQQLNVVFEPRKSSR